MKMIRREMLLIALLMFIMLLTGSMEAVSDVRSTNELDGSKIESVNVMWITQDSLNMAEGTATPQEELDDKRHLFLSSVGNNELSMMFKVEVALSGQYDYAPGDVTITIPKQIWHTRTYEEIGENDETVGIPNPDKLQGYLELPLPAAPSKKADFNWQIIGENYVLTNSRSINATSSIYIEVAIRGISPANVVDMSHSDPLFAHCEVATNQGNTIELTSDPIYAQIDTQAKITGVYKSGTVYENAPELPASLLTRLPEGANPDDYLYVRWYTYHSNNNNQPYSVKIEDTLGDAYEVITNENGDKEKQFLTKGIFLGSTNYEGELFAEGDVDFAANVGEHIDRNSTGTQYANTVYMWSAYPKAFFEVPMSNEPRREYCFENEIKWILTESDRAVMDATHGKDEDTQKVTTAEKSATLYYAPVKQVTIPPVWTRPLGSFTVNKLTTSTHKYAMHQLKNCENVDVSFSVVTKGYGYPWTTEQTKGYSYADLNKAGTNDELNTLELDPASFGKFGWKQVTEDYQTFFNFEKTPLISEDFEFKSLRISTPIRLRYSEPTNQTSSAYVYAKDNSLPVPDLVIEYQVNESGNWLHAATATWGNNGVGQFSFKNVASDVTATGMTLLFPENVTDIRHSYISNVFNGVTAQQCDIAAVEWNVYPTITLKASDRVQQIVQHLFETTENPSTRFQNDVTMNTYGWVDENGEGVVVLDSRHDYSVATLESAHYGVALSKSLSSDIDVDIENQRLILHYRADLVEQSNQKVRSEYNAAVSSGIIPAETSGVWYDLLPPYVVPMLDTVELRSNDRITNIYTIENYKNSNRTLLVVEADLMPTLTYNGQGYADAAYLKFDAFYTWGDMDEHGRELVNYVAFESTTKNLQNNTLGTIKNQMGEPDSPLGGNNTKTPYMPADIISALTDLDPNTDENRFVYAKSSHTVNALIYAVSGLQKTVKDPLVGVWSQGLNGQNQVAVYEGNNYIYSLRVSSAENTSTKDIIIYDTIENYIIPDPSADESEDVTKAEDYEHTQTRKSWTGEWAEMGQWRGTLTEVDLSEFVNAGAKPKLLYSLLPGLQFEETSEASGTFTSGNYDISDNSIWTAAELDQNGRWIVPDGLNVSAVAIDATSAANGGDFVLRPEKDVAAYLKMRAPDDNGDETKWNAKGTYARLVDAEGNLILDAEGNQQIDWQAAGNAENNMYAYNNARVVLVQGNVSQDGDQEETEWLSGVRMIRNDYTRVGIVPESLTIEKKWQDQNNHDGIRPASVTVSVLRRLAGVAGEAQPVLDKNGQPVTVVLNADNGWKNEIKQMDIFNEDGIRYLYSFEEQPVEGYTNQLRFVDTGYYELTNIHPNEQIELCGVKKWNDNSNEHGFRPGSVKLRLYRDGELLQTKTITSNGTDEWPYSFGSMNKYAEGGREYEYTVVEEYVPKYQSESRGYQMVNNTYLPFGDLEVSKTLKNATAAALKKAFTFTLVLLEEQTDPTLPIVPLMDTYAYVLYEKRGGEWVAIGDGKIGNGESFTLKNDQKLVVKDLPSESMYEVYETKVSGFTSKATDASGAIRAGHTAQAVFTNEYHSSGNVQLVVGKKLVGHAISEKQFRFELVDMNTGSSTFGQVIRTGRVSAPNVTTGGRGEGIQSFADVIFGQLDYTNEDDGQTFFYQLREVDDELPGYTADVKVYDVAVQVEDAGDGSLNLTTTYTDGGAPVSNVEFENEYAATGSTAIKVWKNLEGRPLEEGEFTFELYSYDAASDSVLSLLHTATNDAEGNVVFPALSFDQNSVSLDANNPAAYTYLIRERQGADDTVIYSRQEFVITVCVFDNGDGTLSFSQETTEKINESGNGAGAATIPVFVNRLQPGALSVTKKVQGEGGENPAQEFTFHVKLEGEVAAAYEYEITGPAPTPPPPAPDPTRAPQPTPDLTNVTRFSEEELQGKAYAVLVWDADHEDYGKLTFFRADPNNSVDPYGNAFCFDKEPTATWDWENLRHKDTDKKITHYLVQEDGFYYEELNDDGRPWACNRDITSVYFKDPIKLKQGEYLFEELHNLEKADLRNLDTSEMASMYLMFKWCSSLKELDLSTFDTKNVKNMLRMFDGCSSLEKVNLSSFDTSNVTGMWAMFRETSSLSSVDVRHFDTSNVTSMSEMFNGSGVTSLDLSYFDMSKAGTSSMLRNMPSLETLDISSFGVADECVGSRWSELSTVTLGANTRIRNYSGSTSIQWINVKTNEKLSEYNLFRSANHAGTWVKVVPTYELAFDAGSEGAGAMENQRPAVSRPYIFAPTFVRYGYNLKDFVDDNGVIYSCDQGWVTIPADTYTENQKVTLTARWDKLDTTVRVSEKGFTFTLKANETATFGGLTASVAYTVWEETPKGWMLVEKTNDSGRIAPLETCEAVFTNEHTIDKVTAVLRAGKLLDGVPADTAFTFTLSRNGTVEQTKQSTPGGISFDPITYTAAGEYTYTIAEVAGDNQTIQYDNSVYTVTVTVSKDSSGNLSATVVYVTEDGEPPVFQNTTKPGSLTIGKVIEGTLTDRAEAQAFTIELSLTDALLQPWSGMLGMGEGLLTVTDGKGTVTLHGGESVTLTNIPAGLKYEVKETGSLPGWQMDSIVKAGTIEAAGTVEISFTNQYSLTSNVAVTAQKQLTGRGLMGDEFTFQLQELDGTVIDTATNGADGNILFDGVSLEEEGEYQYKIVELVGEDSTINYSDEEIYVTINAVDENGNGTLTANITYNPEHKTFVNSVKTGALSVSKTVESNYQGHAEAEFEFAMFLTDAAGQPVSGVYPLNDNESLTVTNGEAVLKVKSGETAVIDELPHGVNYSVTEAAVPGFTMESSGATGTIAANQTSEVAFKNTYRAEGEYTFAAKKELTGRTIQAGEFEFVLSDAEDRMIDTVSNDENGRIVFAPLYFTDADAGTKIYRITETNAREAGMTYDAAEWEITLTIADNGNGTLTVNDDLNGETVTFRNSYQDKTSVSVKKEWADENDKFGIRPAGIQVALYQNGEKLEEATLTETNNWEHQFGNLAAFDAAGEHYFYTVREAKTAGYESSQSNRDGVTVITNTVQGVLDVSKTVVDGDENKEFSFTVTLTKANAPLDTEIILCKGESMENVTPDNAGKISFLLKHGETVRLIGLPVGTGYLVEEREEAGYTLTAENEAGVIQRYEENKVNFVNSYSVEPVTLSFPVKKTLRVPGELMANSIAEQFTFTLTAEEGVPMPEIVSCTNPDADGGTMIFGDIEYTEPGEYIYTVTESGEVAGIMNDANASKFVTVTVTDNGNGTMSAVADSTTDEPLTFENVLITTEFRIRKQWRGESGGRIILTLYANGEKMEPQPQYDNFGDIYEYTELLKYDEAGNLIIYTAKEKYMDGYLTIYSNEAPYESVANVVHNGGTIINKAVTNFKVQKIWSGLPDDAERPQITLVLYCNGEVYSHKTPAPDRQGWYRYINLPAYVNGERAVYSVIEEPIAGCAVTYTNAGAEGECAYDGGIITNRFIPKTGDEAKVGLWLAMLMLSAAGIAFARRRKE